MWVRFLRERMISAAILWLSLRHCDASMRMASFSPYNNVELLLNPR